MTKTNLDLELETARREFGPEGHAVQQVADPAAVVGGILFDRRHQLLAGFGIALFEIKLDPVAKRLFFGAGFGAGFWGGKGHQQQGSKEKARNGVRHGGLRGSVGV